MIKFTIDTVSRVRIATLQGMIDPGELISAYRHLLDDSGYDPALNNLIDLRGIIRAKIGPATLWELHRLYRLIDAHGIRSRTAIVASIDYLFGIARMYQAIRQDGPEEIQVFREMSDAERWLGIGDGGTLPPMGSWPRLAVGGQRIDIVSVHQPMQGQVQRRRSPRYTARSSTQLSFRKGSLGLDADLAPRLLDVSEWGARLVVSSKLLEGQKVQTSFLGPTILREVVRDGAVVWQVPADDGTFCTGIQFEKSLDYSCLQGISTMHRV